ncbi:hypothetical protein [Streptomyces sp. CL12]|uniref:hypothetical protein n=1 Tax=Streptomyces sp. CL12 TaxID=3391744 RepID=UPI003A807C2A
MRVRDAARLGCALAALALESVGPQQYTVHPGDLAARLTKTYGASTGRRLVGRPEIAPIA